MPQLPTGRCLAALASALLATPVLAAPRSGPELADWLSRNTDLPAAQVAIVAPEDVYSLQQLGPSLPTGEVIALVRTEVLAADWGKAHGFQSWEANLMFDCRGGRVKILRSTVYPEPNRQGAAKVESTGGDWFAPKSPEPAAQLLAAACDRSFVWPLRAIPAATTPAPARVPKSENLPVVITSAPSDDDAKAASASPAPPRPAAGQYALQIVYGPSEADARKILADARTTLGPAAAGLDDVMQRSEFGRHKSPRHTGYLSGFADAAAAQRACETLLKAGHDCVVRPAPPATAASAVPSPVAAEPPAAAYSVQVARGPSEAGAKKALAQARKTLGPMAETLTDATDAAQLRHRRRYIARLTGFPTAAAADEACRKLSSAGQDCFARAEPAQP
jgi:hypothetical protein